MSKPTVAVLMGGPDAEQVISIRSGKAVASALDQSTEFEVKRFVINKTTIEHLKHMDADAFFPVLHGPYGEGGPLQELLEECGIPFVGSTSEPARIAMDKHLTKDVAVKTGVKTPHWMPIVNGSNVTIELPFVLKPTDEGSSVGLAICKSQEDASTAINNLIGDKPYIAEEFVTGHEITISILDGEPLSVIEIVPPEDIGTYDFEAKYQRGDTSYLLNPEIPLHESVASALKMYEALGLRDLARIDFIVNENESMFLEANTMPGFTDSSLFPMAAKDCGFSMVELCEKLVQLALARG